MRSLIFCVLFLCGFVINSGATEYISREMLSNSSVTALPGSLPVNYSRELAPEEMTVNAVSKTAGFLGGNSKLTLGLVGGIGALGILGVLSAPVAIVTAAAVGGLALVGAMTDPANKTYTGHATSNYGILGTGSAGVYGASAGNRPQGIMDGVFGVSNPARFEYGLGSIGVSSSNRAPVYTNMQTPHVMNVAGLSNFMQYDSGYSNEYMGPVQGYGMNGMGMNSYGMNSQSLWGPYVPGSVPLAASSSDSDNTGSAPANATGSFNLFQPVTTTQYYDRRGGENFSNFFERTDNASVVTGQRSTLGTESNRSMWFPNVHYNWQESVVRPQSYLSQSWEYTGQNNWAQSNTPTGLPPFPQTQYPQYQYPQYQYPQYQYPQYQNGLPPFPQQQPQYHTGLLFPQQNGLPPFPQQNTGNQAAQGLPYFPQQQPTQAYPDETTGLPQFQQTAPYNNVQESDPFQFQFRTPAQYYDVNAGSGYPYGNAYQTQGVPGNYSQNFQYDASGRPLNMGYQPYPSNALNTQANQNYYLTPQTAPGVQPAQANYAVYQQQYQSFDPYSTNVPPVSGINTNVNSNPSYAEEQHQAVQSNQAAVIQNQISVMDGAMAPAESFDALQAAEEKRRELYNNLLEAMKSGDDESRRRHFEDYQEVSKEIIRLRTE
jgi:hypothetical protein